MGGLNETSLQTYQYCDGSNTTMLVRSFGTKPNDDITLFGGFGGSTDFHGTNSFVLEGKTNYKLDEHFSVQARLRNFFNTRNSTSQLRGAVEYHTNLNDKVSLYIDPYIAGKYNYHKDKISTDYGVFGGGTYKLSSENSLSCEVQKYNGLKGGAENFGVNVIFKHCF